MSKRTDLMRTMTCGAFMIALNILLERFLSFQTPIVRIGFGFLPIAFAGILLGWKWGGLVAVLADILGMLLNGAGGIYFFPYTISAFLYGASAGWFLYGRQLTWRRVTLFILAQTLVIGMGLSTLWSYLYANLFTQQAWAFWTVFSSRTVAALAMVPVKILAIRLMGVPFSAHFAQGGKALR